MTIGRLGCGLSVRIVEDLSTAERQLSVLQLGNRRKGKRQEKKKKEGQDESLE